MLLKKWSFVFVLLFIFSLIIGFLIIFNNNKHDNKDLNRIVRTMHIYSIFTTSYNRESIKKFEDISIDYINSVRDVNNQNEFEELTIEYVTKLNELNMDCDYQLIETDQREMIFVMIESLARQNGFSMEDDFTFPYREW